MANENGILTFFLGLLIAYWILSPKSMVEEKSVYLEYCMDFKHNVYSCPERTDVLELQYKIFIDRQIVVGKGGYSHKNCAVYDKDNWSCDKGNNHTVQMLNGKYFDSDNDGSIDEKGQKTAISRYQQIPNYLHWMLYIKSALL